MSKSDRQKPPRPYADFPLFPHANGQWAKKFHGRCYYFGAWADWQTALTNYQQEKDAIRLGLPRDAYLRQTVDIEHLIARYLQVQDIRHTAGTLTRGTLLQRQHACQLLKKHIHPSRALDSIRPDDFLPLYAALTKQYQTKTADSVIGRIRGIFRFAHDEGLTEQPIRFGSVFRGSSALNRRRQRVHKTPHTFTAAEIRRLLQRPEIKHQVITLLGINCGFGNMDCITLHCDEVDLQQGWVRHPRPKTGVLRHCALWPETVKAIQECIEQYGQIASGHVLPPSYGVNGINDVSGAALVGQHFRCVLNREFKESNDDSRRLLEKSFGHYALRHTFATVAQGALDRPAVKIIMGHTENDMLAEFYEHQPPPEWQARIRAVTDYVRNWLFTAGNT